MPRVWEIGGNPPDLAAKPPDPAKWPGAEGAIKMAPQAKIFKIPLRNAHN